MTSLPMASLAEHLVERIRRDGPITVAEYMAEALGHPEHGYYMKQDPFGADGDFTTAPEISQMFGELIGLWCAVVWQAMGAPAPVNLVELGPGRGTLMADALRAGGAAPGFMDAVSMHLVETSPVLKAMQAETLGSSGAKPSASTPTWHDSLDGVPDGPTILIANEFFDALPVRQFIRGADGWSERTVEVDDDPSGEGPAFQLGLSMPMAVAPLVPAELAEAPLGGVFEACPPATDMVHAIGQRLVRFGGAALIFDYGHFDSVLGETLQAVKGHDFHDVLADPGDADLTAHVDFGALARAATDAGAEVRGPVPQGAFLERLGIGERAEALLADASPEQAEDIRTAHKRLTDADDMGLLFKVLAITAPGLGVPPWA